MFTILMGVAGSGKTTIGKMLAFELGWPFHDADDFHPTENLIKMSTGVPLNDSDRAPWLGALRDLIKAGLERQENGVLACSALKASYRDQLQVDKKRVILVYLKGDEDLISARLGDRHGHFMKAEMLAGQFETLEEPLDAFQIDISRPPAEIVAEIVRYIERSGLKRQ